MNSDCVWGVNYTWIEEVSLIYSNALCMQMFLLFFNEELVVMIAAKLVQGS